MVRVDFLSELLTNMIIFFPYLIICGLSQGSLLLLTLILLKIRLIMNHILISIYLSLNSPEHFSCVSTGSDSQTENPQEGLREHLKKTLEFCLSR